MKRGSWYLDGTYRALSRSFRCADWTLHPPGPPFEHHSIRFDPHHRRIAVRSAGKRTPGTLHHSRYATVPHQHEQPSVLARLVRQPEPPTSQEFGSNTAIYRVCKKNMDTTAKSILSAFKIWMLFLTEIYMYISIYSTFFWYPYKICFVFKKFNFNILKSYI